MVERPAVNRLVTGSSPVRGVFLICMVKLPLYLELIKAGFPSPTGNDIESYLSLDEYLIKNKNSTFFVRVSGDSMVDDGIVSNDILIVDRSLEPNREDIIIACLNGEFTVKRIKYKDGFVYLIPANSKYKEIKILPEDDFTVWGVVTSLIRKIK